MAQTLPTLLDARLLSVLGAVLITQGQTYVYQEVLTEAKYAFQQLGPPADVNISALSRFCFSVKACCNAHVIISETAQPSAANDYEIIIGGFDNEFTFITTAFDTSKSLAKVFHITGHGPLNSSEYHDFYVSWSGGEISAVRVKRNSGRPAAEDVLVRYRPTKSLYQVNYLFVSGYRNKPGKWRIDYECQMLLYTTTSMTMTTAATTTDTATTAAATTDIATTAATTTSDTAKTAAATTDTATTAAATTTDTATTAAITTSDTATTAAATTGTATTAAATTADTATTAATTTSDTATTMATTTSDTATTVATTTDAATTAAATTDTATTAATTTTSDTATMAATTTSVTTTTAATTTDTATTAATPTDTATTAATTLDAATKTAVTTDTATAEAATTTTAVAAAAMSSVSTSAQSSTAETVNTEPTTQTQSPSTNTNCPCQCMFNNSTLQISTPGVGRENPFKELLVPATTTSAYRRKRTSAEDKRLSSAFLGMFGIVCVTIPFVLIVLADAVNLIRFMGRCGVNKPVESSGKADKC